jgi:hypothetical protein
MWMAGLYTTLRADRRFRRGLGHAASLGPLSVPPSWLWAAASPSVRTGAGSGWPLFFEGLPRTAGAHAAADAGNAAAVKYGGS